MIRLLAHAVLASRGDDASVQKLLAAIGREDSRELWAAARALRLVYVVECVTALQERVRRVQYTDATYDVLTALGRVPPTSPEAPPTASCIAEFLERTRPYAMWDSIRVQAIQTLGRLKVETTIPHLVRELDSDNPSIVHAAIHAMERILGVRRTVTRVLEAAGQATPDRLRGFADALRFRSSDAVVEELETAMVSGPDAQRHLAQSLLVEMGGPAAYQKLQARADQVEKYREALQAAEEKVRQLFSDSLHDAQTGFRSTLRMDLITFGLGVLLISLSAFAALFGADHFGEWLAASITGAGGTLAALYGLFFAKPRELVQDSVTRLMELKIVFLGYLRQLHQIDQAFIRQLIEADELTEANVKSFRELVQLSIGEALNGLRGRDSDG